MMKIKNLNIFLLNRNLSSFKSYLKEEYREKRIRKHYIDKKKIVGDIEKGIIYLYEEPLHRPEWIDYLTTISLTKRIKVSPRHTIKAVLFLTIKANNIRKTFAISFGRGITLIDPTYIVPNFGQKVSKGMLDLNKIVSIESTSIDRKLYDTKKQSAEFLIPERLLEYDTQNVVRNVFGVYKEFDKNFSLGGSESLIFRGSIDLLTDLEKWLTRFANIYSREENNLGIQEDLIIAGKNEKNRLDQELGNKIIDIINSDPITGKKITSLKIIPHEVFDTEDFYGFFISGLGYKPSKLSSEYFIDTINYFERLKRQLNQDKKNVDSILRKITTDKIYRKNEEGELHPVCSVYKAINFETTLDSKKYILVSGTWYEIDKEFYSKLKNFIDNIASPSRENSINFIEFNSDKHFKMVKKDGELVPRLSEGKYNEDLAKTNGALLLDRKDYKPDLETMKKYGLKTRSSIELCDVLFFNKNQIQFIHVKRHDGAAGISHLLSQALVSAQVFINHTNKVIRHINEKIEKFNEMNKELCSIQKLNYENQEREIVLAIIEDKKNIRKRNSGLLSLLEMISIRQNLKHLEYLGFKCYLKFIPSNK